MFKTGHTSGIGKGAAAFAIALVVLLALGAAGEPALAAGRYCHASLLRENWIRVADLDRALALYVGTIGFSEQLVKKRTLSKKLARDPFEGREVRTADLCRRRGPIHALRVIEATEEMIDLPPEDQTLVMQFHVSELERTVEALPGELAAGGRWSTFEGETAFVFEDYDGNRVILTGGYRKAR